MNRLKVAWAGASALARAGLISLACLALAGLATSALWPRIAVASAPSKKVAASRDPAANVADDLFWQTFHGGHYDAIQPAIEAMTEVYVRTPRDAVTAARIGWLHTWRVAERARNPSAPATITDDVVLAKKYFREASMLVPSDARYLGFLATQVLAEAHIDQDERETREGYFMLLDAVKAWPEFNLFTAGYVVSDAPVESAQFKAGLEQQWRNLDVCVERALQPNRSRLRPVHGTRYEGGTEACVLELLDRAAQHRGVLPEHGRHAGQERGLAHGRRDLRQRESFTRVLVLEVPGRPGATDRACERERGEIQPPRVGCRGGDHARLDFCLHGLPSGLIAAPRIEPKENTMKDMTESAAPIEVSSAGAPLKRSRARRVLQAAGLAFAGVVLAAAVFVVVEGSSFDASMARTYDVPVPAITSSRDPAIVSRGKHLVESTAGCAADQCHGADLGGGHVLNLGPIGRYTGPNITTGGLAAGYSDGELARLVRYGVKRDGRSVRFMPVQDFGWLSDDDLSALVSYLRVAPRVNRPNGVSETTSPGQGVQSMEPRGPRRRAPSHEDRGEQAAAAVTHGGVRAGARARMHHVPRRAPERRADSGFAVLRSRTARPNATS